MNANTIQTFTFTFIAQTALIMSSEEMAHENGDFPRPIWKYSNILAFSLLYSPNETARVPEIYNFVIDHFPFFNTMEVQSLKSCLVKTLDAYPLLFKKVKHSARKVYWTFTDRSLAFEELEKLWWQPDGGVNVKIGMKYPGLFEILMFENPNNYLVLLFSKSLQSAPSSEIEAANFKSTRVLDSFINSMGYGVIDDKKHLNSDEENFPLFNNSDE